MSNTNPLRWISKSSTLLWVLYMLVLYLVHRSHYLLSISHLTYSSQLVLIALCITILLALTYYTRVKFNGLLAYILLLIFTVIIYSGYTDRPYFQDLSRAKPFFALGNLVVLHLEVAFYLVSSMLLGMLIPIPQLDKIENRDKYPIYLGVGIMIHSLYAFLLAAFGWLNIYTVWPVIILPYLLRYRDAIGLMKSCFKQGLYEKKESGSWLKGLMFSLIILTLSMYMLGAYKLFPIGFDSTAIYQNISNLIFTTGNLPKGYHPSNWSIYTSMGAIAFGNMKVSLFLSHVMIVPLLWLTYRISRMVINQKQSIYLVLMLVVLPGIGFLSFVDAKVDLAYAYFTLLPIYYLIKLDKSASVNLLSRSVMITIGLWLGYLMGVKFLAIMVFAAVVSILLYKSLGILGALAGFLGFLAMMLIMRVDKLGQIEMQAWEKWTIIALSLIMALFLLYNACKKKEIALGIIINPILVLGTCFVLSFSPWIIKHATQGAWQNPMSLIFGNTDSARSRYQLDWIESGKIGMKLPEPISNLMISHLGTSPSSYKDDNALVTDWRDKAKLDWYKDLKDLVQGTRSGKREEIQRYLGYEQGVMRYVSAPLDVSIGTNVILERGTDYGVLLAMFIPIFFLLSKHTSRKTKLWQSALLVILTIMSYASTFENQRTKDIDSYLAKMVGESSDLLDFLINGAYVPLLKMKYVLSQALVPLYGLMGEFGFLLSFGFVVLIITAFVWPTKKLWSSFGQVLRYLTVFCLVYGLYWLFFASVIPYYALPIWILFYLIIFYWVSNLESFVDQEMRPFVSRTFMSVSSLLIFFGIIQLFTNQHNNWEDADNLYYPPFAYDLGHSEGSQRTYPDKLPELVSALDEINADKDAKVYRVGTYLNYHIENNHYRVIEDNQLGLYKTVSEVLKDQTGFCEFLKAEGYDYVVFSLSVGSIDRTPQKTLKKKAANFAKMLNKCDVQLVYTDRLVEQTDANGNKRRVKALAGKVIEKGNTAIFRIK